MISKNFAVRFDAFGKQFGGSNLNGRNAICTQLSSAKKEVFHNQNVTLKGRISLKRL